ncbi:hypothetical protein HanOQP8_Chr07g0265401 [Helianthus annuus]|nr:hypothetical protein HanOQP8_Chr07g0265401 [Helianthus annuus]
MVGNTHSLSEKIKSSHWNSKCSNDEDEDLWKPPLFIGFWFHETSTVLSKIHDLLNISVVKVYTRSQVYPYFFKNQHSNL